MLEMIFAYNLLTLADANKTKHDYNQKQHQKTPNNTTRKLLTYSQTTNHETKARSWDSFSLF